MSNEISTNNYKVMSSIYVNMVFPMKMLKNEENLNIIKRDMKRRINVEFDDLKLMSINKCYYYIRKYKRDLRRNVFKMQHSEFFNEIFPENEKNRITWCYLEKDRLEYLKNIMFKRGVLSRLDGNGTYTNFKDYHTDNINHIRSKNLESNYEIIDRVNIICEKLLRYYDEDIDMNSICYDFADLDLNSKDDVLFTGCNSLVCINVIDVDNWSDVISSGNKQLGHVYSQIFLMLSNNEKIDLQKYLDSYWDKLQEVADHDEVTVRERLYRGCTLSHLIYFILLTTDHTILGRNWFEFHCKKAGIYEELNEITQVSQIGVKLVNTTMHCGNGVQYCHRKDRGLRDKIFTSLCRNNFMDRMKKMELLHLITDEAWIDLEKNRVDVKLYRENLKLNS